MNATEILQQERIPISGNFIGNKKSVCPRCSASRKKKKVKCLSTTIDDRGVRWYCFHCEWNGFEYFDQRSDGVYGVKLYKGKNGKKISDMNRSRRTV